MKKVLFVFTAIFLPCSVSAAILSPYIVDEKSPVVAGDSAQVGSYYGLENYMADYVNGYAHFTFTYTHASCCSDTTPEKAYVTNVDPRTTSFPIVKNNDVLFTLYFIHPTDWYLYDVQFDATGYTTIVRQEGVTEIFNQHTDIPNLLDTDWVSIANTHPPGSINAVAFTPVPLKQNVQAAHVPIVIVPGIMGSWNNEVMFQGNETGTWDFLPGDHTWDNLIATFEEAGYVRNKDLFVAFYDWRQSNINSVVDYLIPTIDKALNYSSSTRVNIIAHSMGGLVARSYIQGHNYRNDVDHFIMLGTPNLGSSDIYTLWEGGYISTNWNQTERLGIGAYLWYMTTATAQTADNYDTVHSFIPSIRELIPTYDFLIDSDNGGTTKLYDNLTEAKNPFLENLNFPALAGNLQNVGEITVIAGSGEGTVGDVTVTNRPDTETKLWTDGQPEPLSPVRDNTNGDNRVLLASAFIGNIFSHPDNFLNEIEINSKHGDLPTNAIHEIFPILGLNDPGDLQPFIEPQNLTTLWFASPVAVKVTDPQGREITKDSSNIPDAIYTGEEDPNGVKMIIIPNGLSGEYKVELTGTGDGEYHMAAGIFTDSGDNLSTVADNVETGEKIEYTVNISDSNGLPVNISNPVIIPPDSGDPAINLLNQLILNLKDYYDNHQIKDSNAYQSLLDLLQSALSSLKDAQLAREKRDENPSYYDYQIKLAYRAASGKLKTFISTARTYKNQKEITDAAEEDLVDKAKAILVLID